MDADQLEQDLTAAFAPRLSGILLPEADSPDQVRALSAALDRFEAERGRDADPVSILPMPETAKGISNLSESLTASDRVIGVIFAGAPGGDLRRDLGAKSTPGAQEILYVRSRVLFEARAAGKRVILDGVYTDLKDLEGLEADTKTGWEIGYTGRTAVHPAQVAPINRVFSPSQEEVAAARALIAAYEAATAEGAGAIRHNGKLVDLAMAREAQLLVELAEQIEHQKQELER